MGCSKSQESSSYTSEEIVFDTQAKEHLNNLFNHFSNFTSLSKDAKPPYNDSVLLGKLEDELDLAVQEARAIAELKCPSSRLDSICRDFVEMQDGVISLHDDISQYYSSGFGKLERQMVNDDMIAMTSISQSIADDYAELEALYGTIK